MQNDTVDNDFSTTVNLLAKRTEQPIVVTHGPVVRPSSDMLPLEIDPGAAKERPYRELVAFLRKENMRLLDLFSLLDRSRTGAVSKIELAYVCKVRRNKINNSCYASSSGYNHADGSDIMQLSC